MEKSFYFIRHGETDWNKKSIYQGWNDIPLNDVGLRQANERSKNISIIGDQVKIFSSPLLRAHQTAKIISSGINYSGEIIKIAEIKECRSEEAARYVLGKKGVAEFPSFEKLGSCSESKEDFFNRVEDGLKRILSLSGNMTPLVVSHGGVATTICEILNVEPFRTPNCCLIYFEKINSGYRATLK